MRHNEIYNTFAKILHNVCYDVEFEAALQLPQGESFIHKTNSTKENARLNIKVNGRCAFRFSRYLFDVMTFDPFAKSSSKNSGKAYRYHKSLKWLKYDQRIIDVKQSKFVPLVFLCNGVAGPSATRSIKKVASKNAEKKKILIGRNDIHKH